MTNITEHILHPWRGIRPWKRHSFVLLIAGHFYIAVGLSYIIEEPQKGRDTALRYALNWWSFNIWGAVFIMAGLLAILSSRWPPISETWGYAILTGLSTGWGMFYLVGILFGHSPNSNITGFLVWCLLGFMWWGISGLANPSPRVSIPPTPPPSNIGG